MSPLSYQSIDVAPVRSEPGEANTATRRTGILMWMQIAHLTTSAAIDPLAGLGWDRWSVTHEYRGFGPIAHPGEGALLDPGPTRRVASSTSTALSSCLHWHTPAPHRTASPAASPPTLPVPLWVWEMCGMGRTPLITRREAQPSLRLGALMRCQVLRGAMQMMECKRQDLIWDLF